jgi:glycosyltransferase involved in cell wall biosynthesis
LIHPTQSDGWPKVMSESMAFGVVPLAGAISSIPQVLAETGAGRALPAEDIFSFVEAIREFLEKPEQWKQASRAGLSSVHLFTYQAYLNSVRSLFYDAWGLESDLFVVQNA